MTAHPDRFGALLRACRAAAGLSQEELSERSGLSLRTIGNLEQERTRWPYRDTVRRLADGLGLAGQDRDAFMSAAGRRLRPGTAADEQPQVIAAVGGQAAPRVGSGVPLPRQLPTAVWHFTGRRAELEFLTGLLGDPGALDGGVVISVIGGTAGAGKTALAIQWAHQVADQFPDGQLYVNLRGFDPGLPMLASEALGGFLAALGLPRPQIPAGTEDRAAAFRSMLAGRRVLIVLDNACDAGQVRPLLPGEPGCLVLVTSRDALAGLVARDGARRVLLDVLPPAEAVALLRALIGPRVQAEPTAAARLADLCCYLPLALRVAAELAAARPAMSLAALAGELESQGRLDALEAGGDQATAVRAVFSWSCRNLSPGAALGFRLAALHPGADFGAHSVAALTGTGHQEAARVLAELARASLVNQADDGRYSMHDLLRAYAAELAAAQYPDACRREALSRLFDHYLHAARHAAGILFPTENLPTADVPGRDCGLAGRDERAAAAWLDAERANLTAVAAYAGQHGWPDHASGLSEALFRYLDGGGFLADALVIHGTAAQRTTRASDRAGAGAFINIGCVFVTLGRYREAEQYFQRALRLSCQAGDHLGEIRALLSLSHLHLRTGAYPDAESSCQQVLELSHATGNLMREARALRIHGLIACYQGRYEQAAMWLVKAIKASRRSGDRACLTDSLISLGDIEARQGRYHQARGHLEQARATCNHIGYAVVNADVTAALGFVDLREGRHQRAAQRLQEALAAFRDEGFCAGEADTLCCLGQLDLQLGRPAQAADHYKQALIIYQRISEPPGEAEARNGLGEAALAQGASRDARAHHEAALAIAGKIGSPEKQARAHEGLGDISAAAAGDAAAARSHWRQALARYTEMGVPDASRIRARLATTPKHDLAMGKTSGWNCG